MNKSGVGMRTNICKALVEHMAGEVNVESTLEMGTKFTISFKTISNVGNCEGSRSSSSSESESFASL